MSFHVCTLISLHMFLKAKLLIKGIYLKVCNFWYIFTNFHPKKFYLIYKVCLEKIQLVLIWEQFAWHQFNLAAKESGLECTCVNNDDFTVLVRGGDRRRWVSMCTAWPSHSKWLSEKSNKSASNFVLSWKHSSTETIWMIQKTAAMGNWWLTAPSWQHTSSCSMSGAEFWWNIKALRWLSPPFRPAFWLFSKLKSPLKGKRFQTISDIQENTMGQLMEIGRTMWGRTQWNENFLLKNYLLKPFIMPFSIGLY